jgi:hypothetical protein
MDQYIKNILISLITFILVFMNFIFSLSGEHVLGKVLLGIASCFALYNLLRSIQAKRQND